jgi:hypothetical protein
MIQFAIRGLPRLLASVRRRIKAMVRHAGGRTGLAARVPPPGSRTGGTGAAATVPETPGFRPVPGSSRVAFPAHHSPLNWPLAIGVESAYQAPLNHALDRRETKRTRTTDRTSFERHT